MSVYTQDKEGNVILLKPDVTLSDLAEEGKKILEEQNVVTDCEQKKVEAVMKKSKQV